MIVGIRTKMREMLPRFRVAHKGSMAGQFSYVQCRIALTITSKVPSFTMYHFFVPYFTSAHLFHFTMSLPSRYFTITSCNNNIDNCGHIPFLQCIVLNNYKQ